MLSNWVHYIHTSLRASTTLTTLTSLSPPLLHALVEERVPPGFTDDQISPLDDHDARKEAGVAAELDDLPLLVGLRVEAHHISVPLTHSLTRPFNTPTPSLTHSPIYLALTIHPHHLLTPPVTSTYSNQPRPTHMHPSRPPTHPLTQPPPVPPTTPPPHMHMLLPPHPLLSVGVLQVVDVSVVPAEADAQQRLGEEAVLSHDHKVSEEASQSLDHPCKQEVGYRHVGVDVLVHSSGDTNSETGSGSWLLRPKGSNGSSTGRDFECS